MSQAPDVSIILPLHDDEAWVAAALRSCLDQTWGNIEVVCVDDASADGTAGIVESLQREDPRIRFYRLVENRTAFYARRVGLQHARAPYVLFLDGDDQLASGAVETTLGLARLHDAELVGFGVDVVTSNGEAPGRFTAELQPRHNELHGEEVLSKLFPIGETAHGHLWRYLWDIRLLRGAYSAIPEEAELRRANDIPIAFLGAALARSYVSTSRRLYRYHWRRGVSGQSTESVDTFDFYLGAMSSMSAIGRGLAMLPALATRRDDIAPIFDSVKLSAIQLLLRRCDQITDPVLQSACVRRLVERVGEVDAVRAAALFYEPAFHLLVPGSVVAPGGVRAPHTVMITTGNLSTGGVQGVVISQAQILRSAGFDVVIVVQSLSGLAFDIPDGVELIGLTGSNRAEKISEYLQVCRDRDVDLIIDHHILYNQNWHFFALAARASGVPTIGWLHNFALRPLYDSNTRSSFLAATLPVLDHVIVLSKTDVAFWKLRGVDRVSYLPNPPSPALATTIVPAMPRPTPTGPLELVWWGRLQQHTKRVRSLIDLAALLHETAFDFRLTIIGPDSGDMSARELRDYAIELGVDEHVVLAGPLHDESLLEALDRAHVYVMTSGVEGYPLTLIEAQAAGLPVVMFELPWLAALESNEGVVAAPQGDIKALAHLVREVGSNADVYERLSSGSRAAAMRALSHDFVGLYRALAANQLPSEHSPATSVADARLLIDLAIGFGEEGILRAGRVERRAQGRADDLRKRLRSEERRARELRSLAARYKQRIVREREARLSARLKAAMRRLIGRR